MDEDIAKAKLSIREAVRLDEVVKRVGSGDARGGDFKKVRGDIWEIRATGERRTFRFYCARDGDDVVLLVFVVKKTQTARADAIELAEARLKSYSPTV